MKGSDYVNEVTVYYFDENDSIQVSVMERNKAKRNKDIAYTARDLVDKKLDSVNYALSNEIFAVKKRIDKIVTLEQKLGEFYESVNETDLRERVPNKETLELIDRAIRELTELKERLI